MSQPNEEEGLLRSVALKNASSIFAARRREDELRAWLAAIVESSDDAIVSKSLDGVIRSWNGGAQRMFGYAAEEVVGKPVTILMPPDRVHEEAVILDRLKRGEQIDHYETVRVRKDGTRLNVSLTVSPVRDADGRVIGASKIARNVTEHRRAEAALRESEERLRAMFNQAAVGIALAGLDGRFAEMNQKFCETLGYPAGELRGMTFVDITHPDDLAETQEHVRRLLSGESVSWSMEKRYVRKDGSSLWSLTTVTLLRDASGAPRRFLGVVEDITPRKRAEEALKDESRVLELLNRTGQLIGSTLDLQSLLQSVTDAATELSGAGFGAFFYNAKDERGDALVLYTLSGAPREAFEQFGHPRATPLFGPTFRGEGVIRCDDVLTDPRYGKMSPHHGMPRNHLPVRSYLAVPVTSRTQDVLGGLFFGHPEPGVFTDRTERLILGVAAQAAVAIDNARLYDDAKRAAEERKHLLEAERAARLEAERVNLMKDEFLATLSHELRTPLNAILGWAQILSSRGHGDEELGEGLSVIERNTRVQTQLIDDLLDMSRIISGKIRLDVQRVDLQDVVRAAVASVRHSADAKEIRLQMVLDPLAGPVRGDPARLQQCFWNLLSNAIKFTPKGGRVQVSLERVNSHVEVSVADNGEGIRPEFLPHVFERFRQADASTTRRHGGLGLGLSIVKSLVELHGGTVRAKSAGEGQGATFAVALPLMVVHPPEEPAPREHPRSEVRPPAATDHPSLAGIKVLAVDDEPDARRLIRRVLEECGATVFVAASSGEAIELVRRERPDMILSDIGMPDEDGYEFIRKVRALRPEEGGRTPAAALTAFARAEDRTRALRAGYQTHVAKPVEPTELTAVVASLAARH